MSRKKQNVIITNETQEERKSLYREIFSMFDKDNSNTVSKDELQSLLIALGRNPTPEEVEKFLGEVDTDRSGQIDFDEFFRVMEKVYNVPPNTIQEVVEAFRIFDLDNSGKISLEEFRRILTKYGNEFTENDINDIFGMIDVDRDNTISYAEFIDVWKFQ